MRAMADYRALRERFLRPIEVTTGAHCGQGHGAARLLAAAGPALMRVGGAADPRRLRHRRQTPSARWRARPRRPSPPRRRSAAPWRSRCSRPTSCTRRKPARWRSTCARPATCAPPTSACSPTRAAPCARRAHPRRAGAADGAAGPRGDPRRQARRHLRPDADGGSRRRRGRGAEGRGAGAGAAGRTARRASCLPDSRARPCSRPIAARRRPISTRSST